MSHFLVLRIFLSINFKRIINPSFQSILNLPFLKLFNHYPLNFLFWEYEMKIYKLILLSLRNFHCRCSVNVYVGACMNVFKWNISPWCMWKWVGLMMKNVSGIFVEKECFHLNLPLNGAESHAKINCIETLTLIWSLTI